MTNNDSSRNGEEFVDQILTSLKIISMIKEGQKVCVRNGLLALESKSTGLKVAFKRWLHNDNRHSTLSYIKNVINNALDVCKLHTNEKTLDKIEKALSECITGLGSLAVTYENDVPIVATIHVMQERIRSNLENMLYYSTTKKTMEENEGGSGSPKKGKSKGFQRQ